MQLHGRCDVGRGDFSLVLGILYMCGNVQARLPVSPGIDWLLAFLIIFGVLYSCYHHFSMLLVYLIIIVYEYCSSRVLFRTAFSFFRFVVRLMVIFVQK